MVNFVKRFLKMGFTYKVIYYSSFRKIDFLSSVRFIKMSWKSTRTYFIQTLLLLYETLLPSLTVVPKTFS